MRVLGAMSAEGPSGHVILGGPRQRAVLAILLIARGDVVSADRLIEDLWNGNPPPRAQGALQAYVSNLRRVFEPDRAPRTPSKILPSAAPGYAVRLPADAVDAWEFEDSVREAARETDPRIRSAILGHALQLWRGDAYAEVAGEPWARAEIARLGELRAVARERLVAATLDSGCASDAVVDATSLTQDHPLREESWRLLALALYSSGRQADALTALRRARAILGDELGLDPGPALVQLESDVLTHQVDQVPSTVLEQHDSHTPLSVEDFFGRADELKSLTDASARIVLLSGEAGVGKSALLRAAASAIRSSGARCILGRCPEVDGAPPAWAWTEILRSLAAVVDPGKHATALAPLLDDDAPLTTRTGRFLLLRAVVDYIGAAAAKRPIVVILDDLHRADPETLTLLTTLAAETQPGVRILVAYRSDEVDAALEETLATLAPSSPTRIRLAGLSPTDSDALVQAVLGREIDRHTLSRLADRTSGNPFYLRESALLLAGEGEVVATSEVPEGVRDVLRRRCARLPELTVAMLRLASVFGREADLEVLLDVAEMDPDTALDAIEAGVVAGLLDDTEPSTVRFTHVLVRDTLYADMTNVRKRRWHGRVAAGIEAHRPHDFAALAYHYAQLSTRAEIRKALHYTVAAAESADQRYAHRSAARFYTEALDILNRLADKTIDERIELLARRISAQVAAGSSIDAAHTRREAVSVAEETGRTDLLIRTLTAGELPTTWLKRNYGEYDARLVELIEHALRRNDIDDATRCRLLCALVDEIRGEEDERASEAAEAAYLLASRLDVPELLGLSLTALWNIVPADLEPERRMQINLDLIALGTDHDLPVFAMIGHHGAFMVEAVRRRFDEMAAHLELESALAEKHRWTQSRATARMSRGMLAHASGDVELAHKYFDEGARSLRASVAFNADSIHALAFITTAFSTGTLVDIEPTLRMLYDAYPAIGADLLALSLSERGRIDEARSVRLQAEPLRHDFFESLLLAVRGFAVLAVGDRDEAERVYSALAKFEGQLAGIGTGTFVLGPVDTVLALLAEFLGRPGAAAHHWERATELAHAWGSSYWIDAATRGSQERSK